jgi:hypothetical protein
VSVIFKPVGLLKREMDRWAGPDGMIVLEGCEGRTISSVCEQHGFPVELVGLFIVDGKSVSKNHILGPDDLVTMVALIGGG